MGRFAVLLQVRCTSMVMVRTYISSRDRGVDGAFETLKSLCCVEQLRLIMFSSTNHPLPEHNRWEDGIPEQGPQWHSSCPLATLPAAHPPRASPIASVLAQLLLGRSATCQDESFYH